MRIKTIINLARNIRESDIEEIVKMEADLIKEGFKNYDIKEAKRVYSAYVALKEYYNIKKSLRKDINKDKYNFERRSN
jgi:hypothetical protein